MNVATPFNGAIFDHRLLARLSLNLAEEAGGIVAFGGALSIGPQIEGASPAAPMRISKPGGLDGVLFATSYKTVRGSFMTAHFGDVAFVRAWLADPSSRSPNGNIWFIESS